MPIDLEKLTPAPWVIQRFASVDEAIDEGHFEWLSGIGGKDAHHHWKDGCACVWLKVGDDATTGLPGCIETTTDNAAFIALARNAFEVMMRRGWWVVPTISGKGWVVRSAGDEFGSDDDPDKEYEIRPDPFTALVEADAWYKANVE